MLLLNKATGLANHSIAARRPGRRRKHGLRRTLLSQVLIASITQSTSQPLFAQLDVIRGEVRVVCQYGMGKEWPVGLAPCCRCCGSWKFRSW